MSGRKKKSKYLNRRERQRLTAACVVLALLLVGLGSYVVWWYANRARIESDARRYRAMYTPVRAAVPASAAPTPRPTTVPTSTPTPEPTPTPTSIPTSTPTTEPTSTPTSEPTSTPTTEPTSTPTVMPTPIPTLEPDPVAVDVPIATANSDTLVFSLPTAPPVQASFNQLLAHNPDTVGYLSIDGLISLPVVQRLDDNDHYLNHNFDGAEAMEGALFLDGVNRLVPEDDCLIIYGHNMKNGAMFGQLSRYRDADYMKEHPLVLFDTIYENREYVPVAAFAASMEPSDDHYFEVRRFVFDGEEFERFAQKLEALSLWRSPVETRYGDRLLLLVTCEYTRREGRFILALRQLRPDENADQVAERIRNGG